MMDLVSSPQPLGDPGKTQKLHRTESGTQPLRFRSFDAFYQYYSKKQTLDGSYHNTTLRPGRVHTFNTHTHSETRTNLLFNKDSASKSKDEKSSPNSRDRRASNPVHKQSPMFTCTTENYSVQGRVKRLCEIFQKAHNDSHYREKLETVISRNKSTKLGSTGATPKCSLQAKPPESEKWPVESVEVVGSEREEESSNKSDLSPTTLTFIERDPNMRPGATLSPLKPSHEIPEEPILREVITLDLSPMASSPLKPSMNSPEPFGSNLEGLDPDLLHLDKRSSEVASPPLKSGDKEHLWDFTVPGEVARGTFNSADGVVEGRDARLNEEEWSKLERNLLIEDILDRFMNDAEFCNSFVSKLESLNVTNNSSQFDKLIDELQFLVQNDSIDSQMDESRKDFEWFFNQPKVIDLKEAEQAPNTAQTTAKESGDVVPLDLGLSPSTPDLTSAEVGPAEPKEIDLSPLSNDDFNSDLIKHFDWVKLS